MSVTSIEVPRNAASSQRDLRIMVVDDSVVIRGLICRWIEAEPGLQVAGSLRDGAAAVAEIERINPDIAILDIEMPVLDGIAALPQLLARKRNLVVIMASTLTRRNAEMSLKALSLGASDYVPKPESTREGNAGDIFRRELIAKIRQFGAKVRAYSPSVPSPPLAPTAMARPLQPVARSANVPVLRPFSRSTPKVLLIGSSTGGPQLLIELVRHIGPVIDRMPVLITQHMPPKFTTILAEHLMRAAGRPAAEGVHGEPVVAGRIYVAPGGLHMRVARKGPSTVIELEDGPMINYCKPAVDPMFETSADVWQDGTLGVVLTGMGSDGAKGGARIVSGGGSVIAQDEATSVVWGMPGAAAHAGICSAILPAAEIGPKLVRLSSGVRP